MHFVTIPAATIGIWITYVLCLCVYRLYFHPLAKYPGPFLARISYWYAFYYAWNGDTPVAVLRCHEKYGHVVRYHPDALMFDEPESQKEIHGFAKNFAKGKHYQPMNTNPHGRPNLAFTSNKKEHARRRRIISQAFSVAATRDSQPYIKDHVDILCKYVRELPVRADKWTAPTDMHDLLYHTATDILTHLVFGKSYNLLTDTTYRGVDKTMTTTKFRLHLVFHYPALFRPGLNHPLDAGTWFAPQIVNAVTDYVQIGAASALERITNPPPKESSPKDVLSYLINATDPETGTAFDPEDIITEASILLLAGGGTTATAAQSLFFHLSRNKYRPVLEALTEELHSIFPTSASISMSDPSDPNGPSFAKCTYLQASLDESLRLLGGPPFWRVAGPGGATITLPKTGTHYIPEGMTAGHPRSVSAHDNAITPEAWSFQPERWIADSSFYSSRNISPADARQAVDYLSKTVSKPFSLGTRSCVAERLAWSMMEFLCAKIVWNFDLRQADGSEGDLGSGGRKGGYQSGVRARREEEDMWQVWGGFTYHGSGPVVQFRARDGGVV